MKETHEEREAFIARFMICGSSGKLYGRTELAASLRAFLRRRWRAFVSPVERHAYVEAFLDNRLEDAGCYGMTPGAVADACERFLFDATDFPEAIAQGAIEARSQW